MSKKSVLGSKMKSLEGDKIDGYPSSKDGYQIVQKLGNGSYGYVVLAKVILGAHKNEKVAIKVLDLDNYGTENWDTIEKELNILRMLNHPNLISSLHTYVDESSLHLVMPFMDGGSCSDLIKNRFKDGFDNEALVASILKETLHGLAYLHEDGRIHRDVKSGNILLSSQGEVKIADFGVSRCLMEAGEKKEMARTFTGTPCWMAPEVMKQDKGYDYKADIWSFGITALELAFGKPPYADHSPMKILVLTLESKPPSTTNYGEKANKFSKSFKNMVDICLKKEAVRRPTAKELLKHKFFKKAQGSEYIKKCLFTDMSPIDRKEIFGKKKMPEETVSIKKAVSIGDFNFDKLQEESEKEVDEKKGIDGNEEVDKPSRFTIEVIEHS